MLRYCSSANKIPADAHSPILVKQTTCIQSRCNNIWCECAFVCERKMAGGRVHVVDCYDHRSVMTWVLPMSHFSHNKQTWRPSDHVLLQISMREKGTFRHVWLKAGQFTKIAASSFPSSEFPQFLTSCLKPDKSFTSLTAQLWVAVYQLVELCKDKRFTHNLDSASKLYLMWYNRNKTLAKLLFKICTSLQFWWIAQYLTEQ